MSQENVEAFNRAVDAFDRQDFEAMLEELDAAVEWYDAVPMMLGGKATVYRGHEGVRDLWRDLDDVFEERRVESQRSATSATASSQPVACTHAARGAAPRRSRLTASYATSRTAR